MNIKAVTLNINCIKILETDKTLEQDINFIILTAGIHFGYI